MEDQLALQALSLHPKRSDASCLLGDQFLEGAHGQTWVVSKRHPCGWEFYAEDPDACHSDRFEGTIKLASRTPKVIPQAMVIPASVNVAADLRSCSKAFEKAR